MRSLLVPGLLALFLAVAPRAQVPELPGVRAVADEVGKRLDVPSGLAVVRVGELLHRSDHGDFQGSTELPIASASKWLAVATVLTLVDEGKLDLDVPVGRYVAEFDRADKKALTLRMCLACTGGVAPRLAGGMRGMDMAKFAAAAADSALRGQPGATFQYGGVGFQIAAVAAERVTGQRWHDLFAERIAAKLRMPATKFGTLVPVGGEAGTTALPWVAGGAVSTLDDYTRFLRMLLGKGELDGVRVLSEASVAAMFRDQVSAHVEVHAVGFDAEQVRYGLGTWITTLADGVLRVSDPGAFGFTPWLDADLGIGGVYAVRDRVARVLPQVERIQEAVRAAMRSPLVAGESSTVELEHDGRDRRYHLHVPPHAQNIVGLPLLLVLHGGGGSGEQARTATGLAEAGVRAGFVVVFPDGTGALRQKLLTWNSGGIAVYASEHDIDDVGFLRAVVKDVQRRVPIDGQKVFAAGHSNGGMMCHRLAREAADVFAGIAVVAGAMNFTAVEAKSPIAVLLIHGSADQHVLYDGGTPRAAIGRAGERKDASVRMAIDYYLARNGLNGYPDKKLDGKVCTEAWVIGKGGTTTLPVKVVTLDGGGHAWPGSTEKPSRLSDTPFPFDASASILQFFTEVAASRPPAAVPAGR
ncbi:MAG: serine hydrolase [Planctomycetes bacterium]|nr:serine hydrolase [Planctomycetota bacterium]